MSDTLSVRPRRFPWPRSPARARGPLSGNTPHHANISVQTHHRHAQKLE